MENSEITISQSDSFDNSKEYKTNLKENLLKPNFSKMKTDSVSINIINDTKVDPEERKLKSNSVISQSDSVTQINYDNLNIPDNTVKQIRKSNSTISQSISIVHSDCNTISLSNEDENENEVENYTQSNEEDEQKKKLLSVVSQSDSISIDMSNITQVNRPNSVISNTDTINVLNDTEENPNVDLKKSDSINRKSMASIDSSKDNQESPKEQKKQKSVARKSIRLLIWIISSVVFILMCYGYFNLICSINENRNLDDLASKYSNKTEINDRYMSFNIVGDKNEKTIVLLPRMGSPSPIVEYKPLTEALSSKYRVITVEPFGYGFSEDVEADRTMEKIVSELHQCIQKLDIKQYYLMGSSLGGLYSLEWAKDFTDEILGFIGLDSSVPGIEAIETEEQFLAKKNKAKLNNSLGFDRIKYLFNSNLLPLDHSYNYSEDDLKIEKILINKKSFTNAIVEDINNYYSNLSKLANVKFPDKVPVLSFVSSESNEANNKWNELQHKVLGNNEHNEVIILDGPHTIHYKQKDAIVKKVKEWKNKKKNNKNKNKKN
jgi:pimeloyl-ACP methyl ester carboxylesterase